MFLSYATSHNHRMADAYCGLQKSIRCGELSMAIYWAGQIGNNENGLKGYPNALKKRLCQISLEDTASWEFASKLFLETKSNQKASFQELLPWVVSLVKLSKTHSTAWLQRVASQYVYEGGKIIKGAEFSLSTTTEIQFAASCLVAYRDDNVKFLRDACGSDGATAVAIYKYINNDPLVFHAWQMHFRRPEIRNRVISILPLSDCGITTEQLETILTTRLELPDEWYDKHTKKGKKLGRGYEHFFEIMIFHPRLYPLPDGVLPSARGGTEPYEEIAKKLYLDFRIDGLEVKSKQLLSVRRSNSKPRFLEISADGTCQLGENIEEEKEEEEKKEEKKEKKRSTPKRSSSSLESEEIYDGEEAEREAEERERGQGQGHGDGLGDDGVAPKKKKQKQTHPSVVALPPLPSLVLNDIDLLQVDKDSRFLGFKNITCICKLNREVAALPGLHVGDRVFIKMGESYQNCRFALRCEQIKFELGLTNFYHSSTLQWLIPTLNYPQLVSEQHPNWSQSITRHYNSSIQKYSRQLSSPASSASASASTPSSSSSSSSSICVPVLITGVFDGLRLCDGMTSLSNGMNLLKILLYRKYLGICDTNATNIMINTSSGVLYSVDETPADEIKLINYLNKGLITSQKLHTTLCERAGNALLTHPSEVGNFISQLQSLELTGTTSGDTGGTGGEDDVLLTKRLRSIHEMTPFDLKTTQLLNNSQGKRNELKKLVRDLKLQYTKDEQEEV